MGFMMNACHLQVIQIFFDMSLLIVFLNRQANQQSIIDSVFRIKYITVPAHSEPNEKTLNQD